MNLRLISSSLSITYEDLTPLEVEYGRSERMGSISNSGRCSAMRLTASKTQAGSRRLVKQGSDGRGDRVRDAARAHHHEGMRPDETESYRDRFNPMVDPLIVEC